MALLLLLMLTIPAGWCMIISDNNGLPYKTIYTDFIILGQHLLPFGYSVGDHTVPRVDDGSSDPLMLNQPFIFFGRSYNQVIVSALI